jgi:anti-sigma B factor antagonist
LVGELDLSNVAVLESELGRLLASDLQTVVVDLADLEFIDSIGLGCLLTATRRSRADGDRLRMLGATGDVDRVLKLTGLDQTLPLIDK